jgi:hypothetical protein
MQTLMGFEPTPPQLKISNQFDTTAIYHKGRYYFPQDIKEPVFWDGELRHPVQAVFYAGKWRQDTFYITPECAKELIVFAKQRGIY